MKKRILLLAIAAILLLSLFACASESKSAYDEYTNYTDIDTFTEEAAAPAAAEDIAEYEGDDIPNESAEGGLGDISAADLTKNDRKLIYTAELEINTLSFEEDYKKITTAMQECGGFISSEDLSGIKPEAYGDSGRTLCLTVRVPIDHYTDFLNALSGVGEMVERNQNTEDVTTYYYDTQARIELYEEHYNKLMEYLKNAKDMDDIISIESEITDVLYTIDTLKGDKRHMDDQIEYTTINIRLYETVKPGEVSTAKETLGERISNAWDSVVSGIGVFLEGFVVVLIAALPILGLLCIPAGIVLAIVLPIKAKKKKKKAALEKANVAQADPAEKES